jgi:hypothetical protein
MHYRFAFTLDQLSKLLPLVVSSCWGRGLSRHHARYNAGDMRQLNSPVKLDVSAALQRFMPAASRQKKWPQQGRGLGPLARSSRHWPRGDEPAPPRERTNSRLVPSRPIPHLRVAKEAAPAPGRTGALVLSSAPHPVTGNAGTCVSSATRWRRPTSATRMQP